MQQSIYRIIDTELFERLMITLVLITALAIGWFVRGIVEANTYVIQTVPLVTVEYETVLINTTNRKTLSHIAREFYPGDWRPVVDRIRALNPHLPPDTRLQPGMEVKLP